jgi:ankyrin repeat protein
MQQDLDSQTPDDSGREAEKLLAEYFRIRREYHQLDRSNPDHAERRAALKSRYYELDRRYAALLKGQRVGADDRSSFSVSRAEILWSGAIEAEERAEQQAEDGELSWIEINTPVEGDGTDEIFEEALRRVEQRTPLELTETDPNAFETASDPEAASPDDDNLESESALGSPSGTDLVEEDESYGPRTADALRELTHRIEFDTPSWNDRSLDESEETLDARPAPEFDESHDEFTPLESGQSHEEFSPSGPDVLRRDVSPAADVADRPADIPGAFEHSVAETPPVDAPVDEDSPSAVEAEDQPAEVLSPAPVDYAPPVDDAPPADDALPASTSPHQPRELYAANPAIDALRDYVSRLSPEPPLAASAEVSRSERLASERAKSAHPRSDHEIRPVSCPSCGETLPAGTEACSYCGARLIAGDTAEGVADAMPPHSQLLTPPRKERPSIGPKLIISLGGLLAIAAATWLIVRGSGLWAQQIDSFLWERRLDFLLEGQSGGILGLAVALLGGALIGLGIFAGRFVRVVISTHELARKGRVETLEKLILRGEDLDARDARGCTPLHFGVVAGQREVVAVLVGNGADLNSHNERGDTPLHMAVANRDHALTQYLVKKGADVEAVNNSGSTLLHVAAWVGDVGLMKLLMDRGLTVDVRTRVGFTPLHFAAQSGHDDAIEFLLTKGADANARSDHGTTPIFPATRNGHLGAVKSLVDAGADFNVRRGHDFESPLGIARIYQRRDIFSFLESVGAEE